MKMVKQVFFTVIITIIHIFLQNNNGITSYTKQRDRHQKMLLNALGNFYYFQRKRHCDIFMHIIRLSAKYQMCFSGISY